MTRFRTVILIGLFCLSSSVQSRNRFHVFTYADYDQIANMRQFYNQLDSFGASIFQTFIPDSAAKYKGLDSLPIELVTHHWKLGYRLWYDDAHVLAFDTCNEFTIDGRMSGENAAAENGYLCPGQNRVGQTATDGTLGRPVQQAALGRDTAGYIENQFDRGVFQRLNKNNSIESVRYDARLRLPSSVLPSPTDTTVVARMIFEDANYYGQCDTAAHYKYRIERLDDTLLIVGTSNGLDTVPTIDRSPSSSVKWVHLQNCYNTEATTDSIDGRQFANVSCVIGGDTIRAVPYRFIEQIRVKDFQSNLTYATLGTDCIFTGGWEPYWYKIYWTGAATMYLDSFFVTDQLGRSFDSLAYGYPANAAQKIMDYYSRNQSLQLNSNGFYTADEVMGLNIKSVQNAKHIFSFISAGYPKVNRALLGTYNLPVPNTFGSQYYDTYIQYSKDSLFMFDFYPNRCWITPSSEVNDITSWQRNLDSSFVPILNTARVRATAISAFQGYQVDFWVVYPSFEVEEQSNNKYVNTSTMWTKQQMRCAANMALAYGARGIGYWLYLSHLGCQPATPPNFNKTATSVASGIAAAEGNYAYSSTGQDTLCQRYATCQCQMSATCDIRGLVDFSGYTTVPNSHWSDYRETNQYLDSMAYFFNTATWNSVGRWTDNLWSISGSILDSVRSARHFTHNDSAYVEVAFYNYQGQNYAYIVNRRSDSSTAALWTYPAIDTQTVSAFWSGHGAYQVWDVYANHADTVFDSLGIVRWNHHLNPGQAVLMRRVSLSMKGSWSGTWTPFTTLQVTGDITVPDSDTLTIGQGAQITLASNSDSLDGGLDRRKCEIIVNGTLRLQGSASHPIVFKPSDTTKDSSWAGIESYGQLVADHIQVRGAYGGLDLYGSADTVQNSTIRDCFMDGVYSWGTPFYLSADTFWSTKVDTSMMYGVSVEGISQNNGPTVSGCLFKNVKFPVYAYDCWGTLQNCTFTRDGALQSSSGSPAVYASWGRLTITGCSFEDYFYGTQNGTRSHMNVSNCVFTSTHIDTSYSHPPYMNTAIMADGGSMSTDTVWNCCFKRVNYRDVYRHNSNVDLGSWLSGCHNNFFVWDTNGTGTYPSYFVSNNSSATLTAEFNGWMAWPGTLANKLYPNPGQIDTAGAYHVADLHCEDFGSGGSKLSTEDSVAAVPLTFGVDQNYPNPFNPTTEIRFTVPQACKVQVQVFNVLGQCIRTLADDNFAPGHHMVLWDGTNVLGERVSSGVYLYRVSAGEFVATRKMVLLK